VYLAGGYMTDSNMEKIKESILTGDRQKLTNAQIASSLGLTVTKLYELRKKLHIHKTNPDNDYVEFKQKWEAETEAYWKVHEGRPTDKLTAMCIARYGFEKTKEIFSIWNLLRNRNGMLYRFLLEEYV